jgi:lysophospholipase L1-like esterase
MKKILFLCFLVCVSSFAEPARLPQLQGVQRIVFLGDSITLAGDYVTDVDCWLVSQGQQVEVLDLGLGSETATDLTEAENAGHKTKFGFPRPFISERIDRLLAATKPDLVFVCYGMNDGGSLPADDSGLKRYAEAVTRLREKILKAGTRQVVLLTPPVRECKAGEWTQNIPDQNLSRYTEWLLAMKTNGWTVVDIHTPMRRALEERRAMNPDFAFTKDNVHPGREGHWVMARCVLEQYFGAKLDGVSRAEDLFPKNGDQLRKLVNERMKTLFAAWMTQIGHQRPGVPGGPGFKPGPSVKQATAKAAEISKRIAALQKN